VAVRRDRPRLVVFRPPSTEVRPSKFELQADRGGRRLCQADVRHDDKPPPDRRRPWPALRPSSTVAVNHRRHRRSSGLKNASSDRWSYAATFRYQRAGTSWLSLKQLRVMTASKSGKRHPISPRPTATKGRLRICLCGQQSMAVEGLTKSAAAGKWPCDRSTRSTP